MKRAKMKKRPNRKTSKLPTQHDVSMPTHRCASSARCPVDQLSGATNVYSKTSSDDTTVGSVGAEVVGTRARRPTVRLSVDYDSAGRYVEK